MSQTDDDSDKSFEATAQKLLEARKKGEIAKSADLLTAAAYAGLLISFLVAGAHSLSLLGSAFAVLIDQSHALSETIFNDGGTALLGGVMGNTGLALLPIFGFPALAVILALLAQRGLVFAPSKLAPKISRVSLIANAKNKFGRSGLFEFAKSFTKLSVYSICLAIFIHVRLDDMLSVLHSGPETAIGLMIEICLEFLFAAVIVALVIGGIDAVWQHFEHLRKNRMSRKEVMDETKNSEGDPYMKQERRQRAHTIAGNRMMADVPTADVVIVNPTHFAVALKWDRSPGKAPVCVAKGVDEVALKIRDIAADHNVPVRSDPPTARALHATTDIGEQIAPDHYRAVAAAIRFAEAMRQRAKGGV